MLSKEWLLRLRSAQAFRHSPSAVPVSAERLPSDSSPAAAVVEVEEVRCGEGNDPEADNQRADGEDPVAGGTIGGGEPGGFADTENLSTNADGHQQGTEDECEPGHGVPLYPIQDGCGKRQSGRPGRKAPDRSGEDSVQEVIA
jgi:hypothetical protein